MTRHVPALVGALFLVLGTYGCSGNGTEPPPPEPTLTGITVGPPNLSLEVGQTQQMSATGNYSDGSRRTVQATWESSLLSVATVSSTGLVTAVGEGNTSISASVGSVSGTQSVSVTGRFCEESTPLSLEAGEFAIVSADECLLIAAGTGDYYRVAVTRPVAVENEGDVHDVRVETRSTSASGLGWTAIPELGAPTHGNAHHDDAHLGETPATGNSARAGFGGTSLARLDGTRLVKEAAISEATRRRHFAMMEEAQRDFHHLGDRVLRSGARLADHLPAPPERLEINSSFRCGAAFEPHLLIGYNDHISVYQDSTLWARGPMSEATAAELTSYYESAVVPMLAENFGDVSDVDENSRVIVTTSPSIGDSISGIVWTGHFLPRSSCAGSNEGELIFLNDSLTNALDDPDPGWFILGTLAHEAQHIVALYHRLASGQGLHPNWIEEGRAELASELSARYQWAAEEGPAIDFQVDATTLLTHLCTPEPCAFKRATYALINQLAGLILHLSTHPNSLVVNPNGASEYHSIYASGWHFTRFVVDGYGAGNAGELTKLLAGPSLLTGITGLETATGRSYRDLLSDLVVAMSLHELGLGAAPGPGITSYDLATVTQIFASPDILTPSGSYPWPLTASGNTNHLPFGDRLVEGPSGPSGFRFHDFQSTGAAQAIFLRVTAQAPATVVVSRLR